MMPLKKNELPEVMPFEQFVNCTEIKEHTIDGKKVWCGRQENFRIIKVLEEDVPQTGEYRLTEIAPNGLPYGTTHYVAGGKHGFYAKSMTDFTWEKNNRGTTLTTNFNEKGETIRHAGSLVNYDPREFSAVEAQIQGDSKAYLLGMGKITEDQAFNASAQISATEAQQTFARAISAAKAYNRLLPSELRLTFGAQAAVG